jgi:aryl-alcohol dehydrogenase-like predicted oxidoreductase
MLRRLKEEDKIVFARSIFLQGLFFLGNEQLSGNLKPAASYLDQLKILAGKAGMTVPQLAFSFVRDLEGITSLLFGAEKVQQVEQNIEFMKGKKISSGIEEEIRATLGDISETIITPALWA